VPFVLRQFPLRDPFIAATGFARNKVAITIVSLLAVLTAPPLDGDPHSRAAPNIVVACAAKSNINGMDHQGSAAQDSQRLNVAKRVAPLATPAAVG